MHYSQLASRKDTISEVALSANIVDIQSGQPKDKSAQKSIRAPLEMIILFTVGTVAAISHDLYYHSLNGQPVSAKRVSQEWNFRIGTGLAFLAKTCWTFAVLTAQAQQIWQTMHGKHLNIQTIDAMFGSAANFTNFRHGNMFKNAKVVTILALVAWCLPLSAIVTPSTLTVTVESHPDSQTLTAKVPMPDFNNATKFAVLGTCSPASCGIQTHSDTYAGAVQYRYPNAETVLQAVATFSSARIQSTVPIYQNSTYELGFFAPAISCSAANQSTVASIDAIDNLTAPPPKSYYYSDSPYTNYYAFVPASNANTSLVAADFSKLPTSWDKIKNATIPIAPELWIKSGKYQEEDYHACVLYNASYTTNFTFEGGVQSNTVNVTNLNMMTYAIALVDPTNLAHAVGPEFQLFSYQAIWMASVQQLIGRFDNSPLSSSILQTSLVGSVEFKHYFGTTLGASIQPYASNKTIPQTIEEMSQNVTLSFFASQSHLAKNGTTAQITLSDTRNVYQFNQKALLISYGIAVLVTLACIALGFLAYRTNGDSHSLAYSALVQAAKDSNIKMKDIPT